MNYSKCFVLLFIIVLAACSAEAVTTIVYDSGGFESYAVGSIAGQGGWTTNDHDYTQVYNYGGSRGNVLSFNPQDWKITILNLDYTGNPANDIADGSIIKWSFDFYQVGGIQGSVASWDAYNSRNQVRLLPQQANDLRADIRKDGSTGAHPIGNYTSGEWHHIEIYQINSGPDILGEVEVRIFLDGLELTDGHYWTAQHHGTVGSIKALRWGVFVPEDRVYYIDNLVIEEGPEILLPEPPLEIFTVFDSEGFEDYALGSIDGQGDGVWFIPYQYSLDIAEIIELSDSGVHAGRNKVLSFLANNEHNIVFADFYHQGEFNTQSGSIVKWSFDFYQEDSVYGRVTSHRNGSTRQVNLLLEIGNLRGEIRKDAPDGIWWPSHWLGSYTLGQWNHIEVYQFQPHNGEGQVRIWLNGSEIATESTWYVLYPHYVGWIESLAFAPRVTSSGKYYIDNLKVEEGRHIPLPPEICGDWGYLPGDLNQDCVVDVLDLEIMAETWLGDTDINSGWGQIAR